MLFEPKGNLDPLDFLGSHSKDREEKDSLWNCLFFSVIPGEFKWCGENGHVNGGSFLSAMTRRALDGVGTLNI